MIAPDHDIRILSHIPGRIRLHLPCEIEEGENGIKNRLQRIDGVRAVQVNQFTGNLLIHFDQRLINHDILLANLNESLQALRHERTPLLAGQSTISPPHHVSFSPGRVVVRGLLGHALVDSLWFGAGFLGSAMGLPVAGLGPLHVLMDIAVWMTALSDESDLTVVPSAGHRPGRTVLSPTHRSAEFQRCGQA